MKKLVVGVIVLFVSFTSGMLAVPASEYYWGRVEAQADIWRGVHKFRRCSVGHFDPDGTREYEKLLREELDFRIEVVESCGYRMSGYNEVQIAQIERIHGVGTLKRIYNRVTEIQRRKFEASGR